MDAIHEHRPGNQKHPRTAALLETVVFSALIFLEVISGKIALATTTIFFSRKTPFGNRSFVLALHVRDPPALGMKVAPFDIPLAFLGLLRVHFASRQSQAGKTLPRCTGGVPGNGRRAATWSFFTSGQPVPRVVCLWRGAALLKQIRCSCLNSHPTLDCFERKLALKSWHPQPNRQDTPAPRVARGHIRANKKGRS